MNIQPALAHFDIHPTSLTAAVQDVRTFCELEGQGDIQRRGGMLVQSLFEIELPIEAIHGRAVGSLEEWVITIAQAAVEYAYKLNYQIDNDLKGDLLAAAIKRAEGVFFKPGNSWMNATAAKNATTSGGEIKQVSTQVDVVVEIKADGSIKKGGKGVLAAALYKKFLADKAGRGEGPLDTDNQAFIKILIDECQMTKSGATTYNYNMKKQFGAAPETIPAAAGKKVG